MAFSTDQQLLDLKHEILAFQAIPEISPAGTDEQKQRVSAELSRLIAAIERIQSGDSEPAITYEYLSSVAGLQISIGYLYNARKEFESNSLDGFNQTWQAISYLTAGIARLLLAVRSESVAEATI